MSSTVSTVSTVSIVSIVSMSLAQQRHPLKIAVFHKLNHGLSAAVGAVAHRFGTAIRRAALGRGKLCASPAAIAAGRAVRGGVVFFEIAQHAVDDVAIAVSHCHLPFHDGADAKPAHRNTNKKEH
jgi:hypothetical protein